MTVCVLCVCKERSSALQVTRYALVMHCSPMKTLSIFGYGSLLQYSSVLTTMPSAVNHRAAVTQGGFERCFELVSISGIRNGQANLDTREMTAVALRPSRSSEDLPEVRGVVFEIPESEFSAYREREHRYNIREIPIEDAYGNTLSAWTVTARTDEDYKASMPAEEYYERVGQYYEGQLWGDQSVYPLRQYLVNCVDASEKLDKELLQEILPTLSNLLDCAFLADSVTTIRDYIQTNRDRFPEETVQLAVSTPYYKDIREAGSGKLKSSL